MSFDSSASAFHGKEPVVLVTVTIGGTIYRWSTHDVATPDGMFDGRIIDGGSVDREIRPGDVSGSDVNITLSNHDSTLDALISDYGTISPYKAVIVIQRGFVDLAYGDFETIVTLDFLSLEPYGDDRLVRLKATDANKWAEGKIFPPTCAEVLVALQIAAPLDWQTVSLHTSKRTKRVPIVVGSAEVMDINESQGYVASMGASSEQSPPQSAHVAALGDVAPFIGGITFAAISKYGFDAYPLVEQFFQTGFTNARQFNEGEINKVSVESIQITLESETWYVLVVKKRQSAHAQNIPGGFILDKEHSESIRYKVNTYAPGGASGSHWTPSNIAQGLYESVRGNEGAWAANSVTADWGREVEREDGIHQMMTIYEESEFLPLMSQAMKEAGIDLYTSKDRKFGSVTTEAPTAFTPDYSDEVVYPLFSEESNIVSFQLRVPVAGTRWGLATRAHVFWDRDPEEDLVVRAGIDVQQIFDQLDRLVIEVNEEAEERHDTKIIVKGGGITLTSRLSGEMVATRLLSYRDNPANLINIKATIYGTRVELGDIVRVKHSAAPWSDEHICVVYSIQDDLNDHTVDLLLVDLDGSLNQKGFRYDTRANWTHADTSTPNVGATVTFTNGSSTVTANAADTFGGVLVGDILRSWSPVNRFEGIVVSTDQDATLALSNLGGGYGPTNDTYISGGSTNWAILRSQATRGTTPDKSGTPIQNVYGAYADNEDDLFLDDATVPYEYS